MAADVVAPIAVAHVGCGGCEIRQIAEHLPAGIGVSGETYLITVASDASPAVIDHRTSRVDALAFTLAHHVIEEGVVQPESVAKSRHIFAFLPLLPVEPPEIHTLFLERTDYGVEVGIGPVLIVYSERNRSLAAISIDITFRSVIDGSA